MRLRVLALLLVLGAQHCASAEDLKAGTVLVASDVFMRDPRFAQSVVLIVRYDSTGTIGLILNHPTKANVHQLFPDSTDTTTMANPILLGGPVGASKILMLVRTNENFQGSEKVSDQITFSANANAIKDWISRETRKERIHLFAGYSGWARGQLEMEIRNGGWKLLSADFKLVFEAETKTMWEEMTQKTTLEQAGVFEETGKTGTFATK